MEHREDPAPSVPPARGTDGPTSPHLADRETEALHRLVQVALRADSLEMLCGGALDAVATAMEVDRAAILLADAAGHLRFKAWSGLSDTYRRAVDGHLPPTQGGWDPRPVVMNEVDTDPGSVPFRAALAQEGIRSLAVVPLMHQNLLIGKLMLYAPEPGRFGPTEIGLARGLSGTLALAIVRLQQEAALKEREARLNALFKALPVMIFEAETGSPMAATWVSPNAQAMTGFGPASFLSERDFWKTRIHPEDREAVLRAFEQVRPGLPLELEYRWKVADGSYHWFLDHSEAVEQLLDGRYRLVGIWFDVSDRRGAEDALRQSEKKFALAFQNSPDAVLITRLRDGVLVDVNEGFLETTGWSREEVIGRTSEELGLWVNAEERGRLFEGLESAGSVRDLESTFRGKDGRTGIGWVSASLFQNAGETFVLTVSRNITERKRFEEALHETQKLESLGLLAGGIAHDFNNLLTALMGNLNLAQTRIPRASPAHVQLEGMEKILLRASELTGQLLAYSGKGRFVVKPHDLNALVREMASLLAVSLPKKVRLELDLASSLPAFLVDGTQVQQVVMNLVTNAADAIGDAEGEIRVRTEACRLEAEAIARQFPGQPLVPGPHLLLTVADTGCGMSAEVLARIFDPFYTTKTKGRGLGLSAMQGILRGHRAGFRIRSQPGEGTAFQVYFPANPGVSGPEQVDAPQGPGRHSGTVLLVDDEEIILESTGSALAGMGFEVLKARDGREALTLFEAHPGLAMVLMDVSMPRMDGPTAFLAMRESRPGVPVVLSSGFDQSGRPDILAAEGLAGFLQKPYRLAELGAMVRKALGLQSA